MDIKPVNAFFTAVGHNIISILQQQQIQAQKKLATGRLQSVLISKELAKHGIEEIADPISRSTKIGRDVYMALVDGSTEELLTFKYPNTPTSAQYLSDFMQRTMKDVIPNPTAHHFLAQYYGTYQDVFLPIIEKKKDHIRYKGLALFKDNKYVGALSTKDSYLFNNLYNETKGGTEELRLKDKTYVTLEKIRSKVKYKVSGNQDNLRVSIHVSMVGQVRDAPGLSIKGNTIKEMEQKYSKESTKRAEKMMKKLQELNVDPLAIGERVRSHFRNFNEKAWKDHYPTVPVEFDMKVRIVNTGIME